MTLGGGQCHNLTPPDLPDLLLYPDLLTNSKRLPKYRIKVICMGVSFLAHDLADAVRQSGLAAWGSVRHSRASLHDNPR